MDETAIDGMEVTQVVDDRAKAAEGEAGSLDTGPAPQGVKWHATPKTRKGRCTKARLLAASREVFREDGFASARVSDIAKAAGLSNGAFYRYFQDKNDVLMGLLHDLTNEMYEFSRVRWDPGDPRRSVYLTTARYFRLYRDNADLIKVEIESAQVNPEVLQLWQNARRMFYDRIARSLRRGQEEGVIRADVDPSLSAALLGGMTEHYAYLTFVLEEEPTRSVEEISANLADLWSNGIVARYIPMATTPATSRAEGFQGDRSDTDTTTA